MKWNDNYKREPRFMNMEKVFTPIYAMGKKEPIEIKCEESDGTVTSNKSGLLSTFSGSDIVMFFNNTQPVVMSCTLTKNSMQCIFPLSDEVRDLMFTRNEFAFMLIGVNEQGDKAMLGGFCTPMDFRTHMSIDELNIEVTIDFDSEISEMKGWFISKNREEINREIGLIYQEKINLWSEANNAA